MDRLDEKWGIDGPVFIQKIAGLSEIQKMAIVDAAERFWVSHEGKDFNSWIDEALKKMGYKNRAEWFRENVRDMIEAAEMKSK